MPHMRIGSMSVRAVDRNSDTGTLSIEAMKARNAPAKMLGAISGRVTRRIVYNQLAPRLCEESFSAGSSCERLAVVVRRMKGTVMIMWPAMIRYSDGRNPIMVKYISAARPKVRPGSTSGDMKKPSPRRARRWRLRARPMAASAPSRTPNPVDQAATSSELKKARWICRDLAGSNSSAYHCSEKPVGGNFSERPSVNEVVSTITTGTTMISSASTASVPITSV